MPWRETLETVALTGDDAASGFRSGVAALDDFFKEQAGQNQRRNVSRTWVLKRTIEGDELPGVLGFYTLTLGALERATLPKQVAKRLPQYPSPVVIIGRLAVDERARGRRCGERLLLDAQARAIVIGDQAGCIGVVVDAKDESAMTFYQRYGYEVLELAEPEREWPRRLFLPMKTLRDGTEE